ncbi:MAG TPA: hypothetical protein VGO60_00245 [Iamia sp.]|nr:hypothetical protein [Iamia sp.]
MTDDRTLADLDTRARAAAAGVRTAVADRPIPAFDPDLVRIDVDARPERPSRTRPAIGLLAAAAAVLVVVAAVVALAGQGDQDGAPADRLGADELRRYALGEVPEDYEVAGVQDGPVGLPDGELGPATVYGSDPSHPVLAVAVLPPSDPGGCALPDAPDDCETDVESGDVPLIAQDLPSIDIGGRRAWDAASTIGGEGVIVEVGDQLALVLGTPARADALQDVAAAVEVGARRASVPAAALPEGLRSLGDVPLTTVLGQYAASLGPLGTFDPITTWSIWYSHPVSGEGVAGGTIAVTVRAGGPLQVALPVLAAVEREQVTVRGHPAILTRVELGASAGPASWWSLRWEERPGEVVEVLTAALEPTLDAEDVQGLAEDIVVVAADEVPGLRQQVADRDLNDPGVTLLGRGTGSDGTQWTFVHGTADANLASGLVLRLGTTVTRWSASAGGTGEGLEDPPSSAPLAEQWAIVESDGQAWAYGPATPEVAAVEIHDGADGLLGEARLLEADGIRGWVAELPTVSTSTGEADEIVVVALDATGAEIDRGQM